jgi:ribonuclease HI
MSAIVQALETLNRLYGPCELQIVSDSAYVVLGSLYPDRKRNANLDLWDSIERAAQVHALVDYRHVPGHAKVKYNEMADELAVAAKRKAKW